MSETQKFFIVNRAATKAEILIYGYIGDYDVSANAFVKELKNLEATYNKIDVRINSGGGSVFEGIAIYNAIKQSPASIDTYIDGLAASMASIIALAGNKVYMSRNASMMTHKPSTFTSGNSDSLKRNAKLLDEIEKTMLAIYSEKTGKAEDDCREMYMNGKDNWFTATEAKDNGLIDDLYDLAPVKKAAQARTEILAYYEYAAQLGFDLVRQGSPTAAQPPNNFKTQDNKMNEITLTAAQLAEMGLTGSVTIDQVMNNYKAMAEAAAKVPTLEASITALTSEKENAEQALKDYKETEVKGKIEALLDGANKEGRISVAQKVKLAAKYADDYEGLKELVDTMQPYQPITGQLGADQFDQKELDSLMAMNGKDLFIQGKFDRLKALSTEGFAKKWKEYTGNEVASPRP